MPIRLMFVLCVWANVSFANINDDLLVIEDKAKGEVKAYDVLVEKARQQQPNFSLQINPGTFSPLQKEIGEAQEAFLFVSFSMPESLIFSLASEASTYQIPVVIQGLIDDDFKKTIRAFAELKKKAAQTNLRFEGLSIDPVWFSEYQIGSVPAFVLSQRDGGCERQQSCPVKRFDVVYGNASIKNSLQIMSEKGDLKRFAQMILEQGHV